MTRMLSLLCLLPALASAAEPAFSVSLTALGDKKIMVIKEVRIATGLGLADAKKLVESPMPVLVKAGLARAQADALAKALTDAGSTAAVAADGTKVDAAAPVAAPAAGGFAVKLESFGQAKIGCIKVVRDATGLGLKDTKDLVEKAPVVVKQGLSKEEAAKLVAALNAAGGTAKVEP